MSADSSSFYKGIFEQQDSKDILNSKAKLYRWLQHIYGKVTTDHNKYRYGLNYTSNLRIKLTKIAPKIDTICEKNNTTHYIIIKLKTIYFSPTPLVNLIRVRGTISLRYSFLIS